MPDDSDFDRLRVVLVASRNPLNMGAAARAMSNFGFFHLRVVNPYSPAFREARSAVGATEVLKRAEEFETLAAALTDCSLVVGTTTARNRILHQPLRVLAEGTAVIRKRLRAGRVALLFGSERVGLSNDDFSYCHWLMHIPTREEHVSMNVGQAVAVCLYELARDVPRTRPPKKSEPERAAGVEVERLTGLLEEALSLSGYPGPAASNQRKLRRLVRKMDLSVQDAEVWQGILRQLLWKIGSLKPRPG